MSRTTEAIARKTLAPGIVQAFSMRTTLVLIYGAACLAVVCLLFLSTTFDTYNYRHAWVSAHLAVIARAFNDFGLFHLGLVPVQNNAPLTASPDAYLHWPPLYPVLLALVFRVFGQGVVVHHLVSVALVLASGLLVWRSFSHGKIPAAMALLTFVSAPLTLRYGFVGLHVHFAIVLTLVALFLFATHTGANAASDHKRQRLMLGCGAVALFAAVMTSWEPLLAMPAFCALAVIDRRRHSFLAFLAFGCAAVLALLAIASLYGAEYPHFLDRLWNRAAMRAGLSVALAPSDFNPHDVQDMAIDNTTLPLSQYLWFGIVKRLPLFGILGLLGIGGGLTCLRSASSLPRPAVAIFLGSLSMYILWAILMRNHMGIHEYEMLIAVPAAASGVGLMFTRYGTFFGLGKEQAAGGSGLPPVASRRALLCHAAVAAMVAISFETAVPFTLRYRPNVNMIALADLTRQSLPDDALVITPEVDMIFVYYAQRHVIRAITDEAVLDGQRRKLTALCSDCPLYLVADPSAAEAFPSYRAITPVAEVANVGTIWRIPPADIRPSN